MYVAYTVLYQSSFVCLIIAPHVQLYGVNRLHS